MTTPTTPAVRPHGVEVPITWKQGDTLNANFRVLAGTSLRDFSGFTARMQVRSNYGVDPIKLELTTANGGIVFLTASDPATDANLGLRATAAQMAAIAQGKYRYDLELVTISGSTEVVERLLYGRFEVVPEVTT
jgi:hypothetical protein